MLAKAALAAALAAGCVAPAPSAPAGNELVVALENAPLQLDPRVGTDQASSRVWELALDGLIAKGPRGELLPGLASSWEILEDGRRYRFQLRDGVRFQDGSTFDAEDVVWTFGTILDGTVTTAKKGGFVQLARVEARSPDVVDFVMSEPFSAMLVNLTSYMGILPSGTTTEEANRRLIGTGPFQVIERDPDRVVLEAFADHFRGRPELDRVVLRQVPDPTVRALELRKGSAQLVVNGLAPDVVPTFRADPRFRVVEDPGSNYTYVGINLRDPVLARPEVRRAIALAIDREMLVRALWRGLGVVTETAMPPGHWARHETLPPVLYDPAAARALLDAAGFPDPDGPGPEPRFTLTYKTSTDETRVLQAQVVQAMLSEVGIAIDIRSYEFATFFADITRGNFQLFSLTWTGILDPDFYALCLHSKKVPPAGANRGHYLNAEFDRLIDAGARAIAPAERRPFYLEAQEILARDLPYLSLFTGVNVAVMPSQLEGYENYMSGELTGLARMRWAPRDGAP